MAIGRDGCSHWPRRDLARLFQAGDLVVANDAATMPASLAGRHVAPGAESRSGWPDASRSTSIASRASPRCFSASATSACARRTGRRRRLWRLVTASRSARCRRPSSRRLHDHPRLVELEFDGRAGRDLGRPRATRTADSVRSRPAAAGRSGTPGRRSPVRPSRSSRLLRVSRSTGGPSRRCEQRGTRFATITHAAGLSSTGDAELDALAAVR